MDFVSFDIFCVDVVVVDVWICECYDLLVVVGVGEDFLVVGDCCVENDFINCGVLCIDWVVNKDCVVCECQDGGWECFFER